MTKGRSQTPILRGRAWLPAGEPEGEGRGVNGTTGKVKASSRRTKGMGDQRSARVGPGQIPILNVLRPRGHCTELDSSVLVSRVSFLLGFYPLCQTPAHTQGCQCDVSLGVAKDLLPCQPFHCTDAGSWYPTALLRTARCSETLKVQRAPPRG